MWILKASSLLSQQASRWVQVHMLVTSDLAAFQYRYPLAPQASIAGVWKGNLDRFGETLSLENATGATIQTFTFAEWYPSVSEVGYSYVIKDPSNTNLTTWSTMSAWRISTFMGSPGTSDVGIPFVDFSVLDPSSRHHWFTLNSSPYCCCSSEWGCWSCVQSHLYLFNNTKLGDDESARSSYRIVG